MRMSVEDDDSVEETYDKNAANPQYKLVSLRDNSFLDY